MYLDEKNLPSFKTETEIQYYNLKNFIAALRSGKYKQTIGELYENGSYCAMGVGYRSLGLTKRQATNNQYGQSLNDTALSMLGLNKNIQDKIMYMNDSHERSFEYIASYLERYHLKRLEKKLSQ